MERAGGKDRRSRRTDRIEKINKMEDFDINKSEFQTITHTACLTPVVRSKYRIVTICPNGFDDVDFAPHGPTVIVVVDHPIRGPYAGKLFGQLY
jgi:hypothetical protein